MSTEGVIAVGRDWFDKISEIVRLGMEVIVVDFHLVGITLVTGICSRAVIMCIRKCACYFRCAVGCLSEATTYSVL